MSPIPDTLHLMQYLVSVKTSQYVILSLTFKSVFLSSDPLSNKGQNAM